MVKTSGADDNIELEVKDANGNVLENGDSVVLIKDLKVKGSSITL
ncbi:MAG: PhnA domain-containing protein [Candidatus Nitrotoga sp.]